MYQGDEDIHRALSAGAATYLLKDALSDDLIRVVREVHAGGHPMAPDVRARLDRARRASDADAAGDSGAPARLARQA